MTDVKVSADKHTREKLGLKNTASEQEAQRIQQETNNSKEFRAAKEKDQLVVKRVLRD
jgi:hypothetical protein